MDDKIRSLTCTWDPEHQKQLFRNRGLAVATVTAHPFTRENGSIVARQDVSPPKNHLRGILCPARQQIDVIIHDLLTKAKSEGRMRPYHVAMDYTLHDVQVSADLGCHLRAVLASSALNYIRDGKPSALEGDREMAGDSWLWLTTNASRMDEVRCHLKMGLINCEVLDDTAVELSFFPKTISDELRGDGVRGGGGGGGMSDDLTIGTGDEATFRVLEDLLKTCRDSHVLCRPTRPPEPNVPRRLLRLGGTMVQVVENTQQAPYVCLSHRWGSQTNVPHKLTQGDQYEPFDISSLPKTFQDAIQITQRLGYTHLWIDCFCIVQGSKQDWLEQSEVMAQIYANSVFTIAALSAKDTHGGCFQRRNPLALQALSTDHFHVIPRNKYLLWRLEIEGSRSQSSPLHTRAWVVQERLSAVRTIFYGSLGVYWECRCLRAPECLVQPVHDVIDNTKTMLRNLQSVAEARDGNGNGGSDSDRDRDRGNKNEFLYRWQRLLEIYSVCALTYFSDKLVALAGITRDIEMYSGKRYVHGLWGEDLTTGLLWFHDYTTDHDNGPLGADDGGRVPDQEFPSWSWASMSGRIQYFASVGTVIWRADVEVLSGTDMDRKWLRVTTWRRDVVLDHEGYLVLVDDGSKRGDLQEEHLWYHDEKRPELEQGPLELLLLQRTSASDEQYLVSVRCLVVTRVRDNNTVLYRRVGLVIIRFNQSRYDPFPVEDPVVGIHDIILV